LARSARFRRLRVTVSAFVDAAREEFAGYRVQLVMATLTVGPEVEWHSRMVSDYCERQSRWLRRRGVPYAYAWVLELQKNGRPHFHVLWAVPRGFRLPMPDKVPVGGRCAFWRYGKSNVKRARSVGYVVKYASKGDAGLPLPTGARLFGLGCVDPRPRSRARWHALPSYLRRRTTQDDRIRRCPGGGWVDVDTGEFFESEWEMETRRLASGAFVSITLRPKAVLKYQPVPRSPLCD
jgi:hypothetical protein